MSTLLYNSFAAGELSPRMMGAVGTTPYQLGCQVLENFIPRASGVTKRPGTYYLGTTLSNGDAVLVSYIDDTGATQMLEFTATKIRAWNVATHAITAASITTPYAAGDIRALRFAQDKQNLYIFHKNFQTRLLTSSAGVLAALSIPSFVGASWPGNVDIAADTITVLGADRLTLNQTIKVAVSAGGTMPTTSTGSLSAATTYYVKAITKTKRTGSEEYEYAVQLSLTSGGALIDITNVGVGVIYLLDPNAVPFPTSDGTGKSPSAGAFYSGRLFLVVPPNDLWGSRVFDAGTGLDRFTDFTLGTAPDKAIRDRENDLGSSAIHWLAPHLALVAGAEYSEWASTGEVPTPETFDLRVAAPYGAADVQGIVAGPGVAYIRAGGRRVGLLQYAQAAGGYQATDLTEMADHLGLPIFRQLDFQSVPDPILWAVRNDGVLCSCSLHGQGLVGWARHPMAMTGGQATVESLCVTRGPVEDELWLVVKRGSVRTVEWMAPHYFAAQASAHFVDCGLDVTQSPALVATLGSAHLDGATVECFADGAVMPAKAVASGTVTYDRTVTRFHIGYQVASRLMPTRPELSGQGSITQGKAKRIIGYVIRLYQSMGGRIGPSLTQTELLLTRSPTTPLGQANPLFTGDIRKSFPGRLDEAADFLIAHEDPAPFEVLATIPTIELVER